jgi:anti-sigma B factor antagonist
MADSTQGAFHIENEAVEGGVLIRPIGELDIATSEALGDALKSAMDSDDVQTVVLGLDAVTFIDSAGVRAVLQAVAASQAGTGKLRVRRDQAEQVTRLFELVGAIDRLPYE